MLESSKFIRMVFISSVFIYLLAVLSSVLYQDSKFALGIVLGGLLSLLNFFIMVKIIRKLLSPDNTHKNGLALKMLGKMFLLFMFITGSLFWMPINPIGFLFGLSIIVLSIAIASLIFLLSNKIVKSEFTDV